MNLKWKRGLPTKPGWYWYRLETNGEVEIDMIKVRLYVGELAVGNALLINWPRMQLAEWAGPIPEPEE